MIPECGTCFDLCVIQVYPEQSKGCVLELLLQSFLRDCFLLRSEADFGVVFKVNLVCFWDVVFRFSWTLCTKVKCGLDPLFTVF